MVEKINLITDSLLKMLEANHYRVKNHGATQDYTKNGEVIISCYVKSEKISPSACDMIVENLIREFDLSENDVIWFLLESNLHYKESFFSPRKKIKDFVLLIKNLD